MKKRILALVTFIGALSADSIESPVACQEVNNQFSYFSLGVGPLPIPLPVFTFGHRMQWNRHGFDFNAQVVTVVQLTDVKVNLLYQYYRKPNLNSQSYIGFGVGPSYVFGRDHTVLISPEFLFGRQYLTKAKDTRFWQAQISFPTVTLTHIYDHRKPFHGAVFYGPVVVISYGLGF